MSDLRTLVKGLRVKDLRLLVEDLLVNVKYEQITALMSSLQRLFGLEVWPALLEGIAGERFPVSTLSDTEAKKVFIELLRLESEDLARFDDLLDHGIFPASEDYPYINQFKLVNTLNVVTPIEMIMDTDLQTILILLDNLEVIAHKYNLHLYHYISIHIEFAKYLPVHDIERKFIKPLKAKGSEMYHPVIYWRVEKYSQFDHLQSIFESHSFQPNDLIMFMDKNDLLLELPDLKQITNGEIAGLAGAQYVPLEDDNFSRDDVYKIMFGSYEDIFEIMTVTDKLWDTRCGFSGYTTKWKHILPYFSSRGKVVDLNRINTPKDESLEDTRFMNYLDKKGVVCDLTSPFVYRRFLLQEE